MHKTYILITKDIDKYKYIYIYIYIDIDIVDIDIDIFVNCSWVDTWRQMTYTQQ